MCQKFAFDTIINVDIRNGRNILVIEYISRNIFCWNTKGVTGGRHWWLNWTAIEILNFCQIHVFFLKNVFLQTAKCIYLTCQMYFFKMYLILVNYVKSMYERIHKFKLQDVYVHRATHFWVNFICFKFQKNYMFSEHKRCHRRQTLVNGQALKF